MHRGAGLIHSTTPSPQLSKLRLQESWPAEPGAWDKLQGEDHKYVASDLHNTSYSKEETIIGAINVFKVTSK